MRRKLDNHHDDQGQSNGVELNDEMVQVIKDHLPPVFRNCELRVCESGEFYIELPPNFYDTEEYQQYFQSHYDEAAKEVRSSIDDDIRSAICGIKQENVMPGSHFNYGVFRGNPRILALAWEAHYEISELITSGETTDGNFTDFHLSIYASQIQEYIKNLSTIFLEVS